MNDIASYEKTLLNLSPKEWTDFLKNNAFTSGQNINIDLAETFAEVGTLMDFKKFIAIDYHQAPENSPASFLTYCGVLGYGKYLSRYFDNGLLFQFRQRANDPRESIRAAVAKAFKTIAQKKFMLFVDHITAWEHITPLEQQALASAICSKPFFENPDTVDIAFELLDWITASLIIEYEEWNWEYGALQQELERRWAIALVERPNQSKAAIEHWIKERHPFINSIMYEVLTNGPVKTLDKEWLDKYLAILQ